jgi:hypothetical protein
MVDNNIKLTILSEPTASVFTDISNECKDYSRDMASITLATTSNLYVGFKKPINNLYVDFLTPNVTASVLTIKYYNGSSFVTTNADDDTKGFTRSGFISWDRNQTTETATTINSVTLFWYKISCSVTMAATVINGISFIFADDQDLKQEVPEIADTEHLTGKTSHILTHVAVRNQIIQDLRSKDYTTTNATTGLKEDLTVWDILDLNQLKQAAIFLALSKIFFNYSDDAEDNYMSKSNAYLDKYSKALAVSRLSLDTDNDGITDEVEQLKEFSSFRLTR